ncbi:PilC/PilY family type IV pilus protein [Paraglaciecola chathamensis]|uniref:Type IV pilus assembly protein PilY1 n=1 Tax=Paraglaciecola chathamensis S18K6 TaxID=1127672 RepID=A0AAV3V043_9ALTE|nr:PilC/PilY family type IV pilus protein [Paraglaciecola chathamensis]GAC10588.1 type IV pilus assembly protein PilY1 [Paraglaciecola chathamensis S18K6]
MLYCRMLFLLLCLSSSMRAWADDLEIYFGTSNEQVKYDPNVLFIMDTSGSMGAYDNTNESRMLRVQNALKETLRSVTNVNAGLMRFSDYGGPILYPVRPIDDTVSPELITPIVQSSDDATERSGSVSLNSSSLTLSAGTEQVITGLRYQMLNIPQGATITSAYLRFTSRGYDASATTINIAAELTANATTFTSSQQNISSRTQTSNQVIWDQENDWPSVGDTVASIDFSSVIQEVVDLADWCGGNNLNIILTAQGLSASSNRLADSFEQGGGLSPQLVVVYDETTATGCITGDLTYQIDSQSNNAEERYNGYQSTGSELTFNANSNDYIGLRFRNIALPQGAVVSNAYLEFTAYQNSYNNSASMTIEAANEADPRSFNNYSRYLLRNKAKTSAVTWSGIERWYRNREYQSPSVASIVNQLVNRGDWQSGNDMMFILSDFNNTRGAYTYSERPSGAAKLVIEFQGQATPGQTSTVREHLVSKVDELSASGYTPIVDTLYEGVLYYGGLDVDYGLTRGNNSVSNTVRRNTRVSHRLSYTGQDATLPSGCEEDNLSSSNCITQQIPQGARYLSPITDRQCQVNNHIVLLSDGEANNNHSVDEIETLLSASCTGSGGEKCGLSLVRNIADTEESVIDSRIITHTIGFAANTQANSFLNQIALQGGGGFYQADNSQELLGAFQSILKTVKDVNATFVSPGVAVNQLNRLTHKDELYFALFKPSEGSNWPGNLKKYKIDGDTILDKNGLPAVDDGNGFFSEQAHSYWSVLTDGNDVRQGGAASKLSLARNLFTFSVPGPLANSANRLHENNISLTGALLNIDMLSDVTTVRSNLLKWVRGVDLKDDDGDGDTSDIRLQMGDPIHSQPVIVNYSATDSAIFVATNQGFLHSFDAQTGSENFAVIPQELLGNLYEFYRENTTSNHIYGLDGDLVLRHFEDKIYLYVGMRRGGRNYYTFDITSKTNPILVHQIVGGNTGFEKLGQTWSRPTVTKIKVGETIRNVLIFGGGYDVEQDNKVARSADSVGNAVFIVDADTGALIWSASNSGADLLLGDMEYSIPARISVIDRDNDGLADHMYVADLGGQLFRLDIHNGLGRSELVSGGLLADLGGDLAEDNRRFYYAPDVAQISTIDENFYAVAIGSGYRAHPLNAEIQDSFYMLKDFGIFTKDEQGDYGLPENPFTRDDLYDATAHLLTSSDQTVVEEQGAIYANRAGWLVDLGSGGEKVLASPLILNYQVFFTTYLPASANDSLCAPPSGNSRAYLVELINGNAVVDLNNDNQTTHQDRFTNLKQTGIAPDTKILIEDILQPVVCLGTECASAVIEIDEQGNEVACTSAFGCLAQNIYGRFERIQKSSWKTEIERQEDE